MVIQSIQFGKRYVDQSVLTQFFVDPQESGRALIGITDDSKDELRFQKEKSPASQQFKSVIQGDL